MFISMQIATIPMACRLLTPLRNVLLGGLLKYVRFLDFTRDIRRNRPCPALICPDEGTIRFKSQIFVISLDRPHFLKELRHTRKMIVQELHSLLLKRQMIPGSEDLPFCFNATQSIGSSHQLRTRRRIDRKAASAICYASQAFLSCALAACLTLSFTAFSVHQCSSPVCFRVLAPSISCINGAGLQF
jgi:hypothetical protein